MKQSLTKYWILAGVFLASFVGALVVPTGEFLRAIMAAPGVVALSAALFQLMRDEAAFEKQRIYQQRDFQFTLGAASHMANTAFDKHVEFCENYMLEINEAVHTLFREADTPEALVHAGSLYRLREYHALWLTDEINKNLENFESAIRKLGAGAKFIENTAGNEYYREQRSLKIDQNHQLFLEVLGIDSRQELNEDYAIEAVKQRVRAILGVEELTRLRSHLVSHASAIVEHS